MTEGDLFRSPLHEIHLREGGRLVAFAGWQMPVQYCGINEEHLAVRNAVGLFDVSHMGQFIVRGTGARSFLQSLLPAPIDKLRIGDMLYTAMCNERGGCIDDLLVYRTQEREYLLVVNAGCTVADWQWIQAQAVSFDQLEIVNNSAETSMLALQGPSAEKLLSKQLGAVVADLPYYCFMTAHFCGHEVVLSRNGYTGEDGFELMCDPRSVVAIWQALRDAGAQPCGLGARDTLRTEMGFSLYGHELNEHISPLEAGIGWTLDLDKREDFVGKKSLVQQKKEKKHRRLRGVEMVDKGIPRPGYELFDERGECIGEMSSGTHSPCLNIGIGLAFIERSKARVGENVFLSVRGRRLAAKLVVPPFVDSYVKKSKGA
ncbi:MAG: glycine cleavage system aminomethyltransferase GcvT [Candidatus Latescibacterota bacterium]|jgi:aminomethyltransferase